MMSSCNSCVYWDVDAGDCYMEECILNWARFGLVPGAHNMYTYDSQDPNGHEKEVQKENEISASRQDTVGKLTDQSLLVDFARNDPDDSVRAAAIMLITDQEILSDIAKNERDGRVRLAAVERLTDQGTLAFVAASNARWIIRKTAADKLSDHALAQTVYMAATKSESETWAREEAILAIADQPFLAETAKTNDSWEVRIVAVNKLTDQRDLEDIVEHHYYSEGMYMGFSYYTYNFPDRPWKVNSFEAFRIAVARRLLSQSVLQNIAQNDESADVRNAAEKRLSELNLEG